MNKDYLHEKMGSDPEIEGLEDLLAVYRFEPGRAPVLPIETVETRRSWFAWLTLSFAAGAAAVAVFAGLLAYGRIEKLLDQYAGRPEISERVTPAVAIPSNEVNVAPAVKNSDVAITDPELPNIAKPTPQRVAFRKPRIATHSEPKAVPAVTLTKQEKYAYDQLMVALYITGTKLKVVQDTIDRVDDQKDGWANNEK